MKQIEDIKTIYKRADNWLFPEVALLTPNPDEITTAKKAILKLLTDKPDACLSFSSGKDSLLLALLTFEVCNENELPLPTLQTSLTGYEVGGGFYHHTILDCVGKYFDIDAYMPPPFRRYSVQVLGVGAQPLNSFHFRDCLTHWKIRTQPRVPFLLVGVRRDESAKRNNDYKDADPFCWLETRGGYFRGVPLVNVSNVTLWDYLKRNVYKLGVSIDFVLNWYQNKDRDGCWCCRFSKNKITPFQCEINRLARKWGKWYLDNRQHMNHEPHCKRRRPVATLKYKKIIYNEVRDLEEKYNVKAIQPLSDDLIKEVWNFQECYLNGDDDNEDNPFNRVNKKLFLTHKDDYKDKALRPDLFKIVFESNPRASFGLSFVCRQKAFEYRNGKKIVYNE